MKKILAGIAIAVTAIVSASPANAAAGNSIKIDGVTVVSDAKPETKSGRTMVPLRVVGENLGAQVNWANSEVTLTKDEKKIVLKPGSDTSVIDGANVKLDAPAYVSHSRVYVPLRFIAEAFGSKVDYADSTVTIATAPLVINGGKVAALQQEFHMTMGGIVQQVKGNAYNEAIYELFQDNLGDKVAAPENYSWLVMAYEPGIYYKNGQYDFLDDKGNSLKRYDIYSTDTSNPEKSKEYPGYLVHDFSEDQWYLFSQAAEQAIAQRIGAADSNGFLTLISNTIV